MEVKSARWQYSNATPGPEYRRLGGANQTDAGLVFKTSTTGHRCRLLRPHSRPAGRHGQGRAVLAALLPIQHRQGVV